MQNFWLVFVTTLALVGCHTGGSRSAAYGLRTSANIDNFAFETSAFMRDFAYGRPLQAFAENAPSGAYGVVNKSWESGGSDKWYIEEQRYGADAIAVGLAHGLPEAIDRGVAIIDWGWRQQQADGSFACPDNAHSAAFFVESVARAGLLLEASPWRTRYQTAVDLWRQSLRKTVAWLLSPEVEPVWRRRDAPYTHRAFRNAAALIEVGVLVNDPALIAKSQQYLEIAYAHQDPAGFFVEKGGYDTSYNGVGLLYAARYYAVSQDAAVRQRLLRAVRRSLEWTKAKIAADGTISSAGNTRTGDKQEVSRSSRPKDISYNYSYKAFHYWGLLLADPQLTEYAKKLHAAERRIRST